MSSTRTSARRAHRFSATIAMFIGALLCSYPVLAQRLALVFGYNSVNKHLVSFSTSSPGPGVGVNLNLLMTGLGAAENVLALDFRPSNGGLYAVVQVNATSARLARIDQTTGLVSPVGAGTFTISGTSFGAAVDAVADNLRLVSDADINYRINLDTGAVTNVDPALAYPMADPGNGVNPRIVHIAYTDQWQGAPATTLFGIDSGRNTLVTINPANSGQLNTVGPLGVDAGDFGGFDIDSLTQRGYAALRVGGVSQLYRIDLFTGAATLVGDMAAGTGIDGIAIAPVTECLDVDGNGKLDALTDGLILLRAMFQLPGSSVMNGTVANPVPPRASWGGLRAMLNQLCGTSFGP